MTDTARARKLADRIQVIVAETLETRIKDPRLGFVTVTDARVTGDLQHATVFYTVFGDAEEQAPPRPPRWRPPRACCAPRSGRRTGMRLTPTLEFVADARPGERARTSRTCSAAAAPRTPTSPRPRPAPSYAGEADPYRPAARTRTRDADDAARRPRPSADDDEAGVEPASAATVARRGLVIVDKPAGWTSHDVVARVRAAGRHPPGRATPARSTRWPPACWCSGSGRATRLLDHLVGADKAYAATIRLGVSHGHRRRRGRGRRPAGTSPG